MIVERILPEQTYEIRKKVLRENIPLPYEFKGDFDKDTVHFGAFINESMVGVASFMKVKFKEYEGIHYQLRGMATLSEFQGKGVGKSLLETADAFLKDVGCTLVWCNARVVALNFYKKNGYQTVGDEFDIQYIGGHFVMFKKL